MLHDLPLQDALVAVADFLLRLLLGFDHLLGHQFASLILLPFLLGFQFSLLGCRSCEVIQVLVVDLILTV